MSLLGAGERTGGGQSPPPLYPGLRPATSPLRGAFDLSLQASGRAEAASVQNTALSPHPCGLPRPSGNVSAMLRPPAPAVSAAPAPVVIWGCRPVRRSRHPAKSRIPCLISCPAALRLHGPTGCEPVSGSCRSDKRSATDKTTAHPLASPHPVLSVDQRFAIEKRWITPSAINAARSDIWAMTSASWLTSR